MALTDCTVLTNQYDLTADKMLQMAQEHPKNIVRIWAKSFPDRKRKEVQRLAFLGGHPRSGTTLLEQLLGAHPDIATIDEPQVLHIAASACSEQSWRPAYPDLNIARQRYTEALRRLHGGEVAGKLLLEKNPSPTALLPVLIRVFPELRVVISLRDPRDVVLSCFFQNIPLNHVNSNFLSFSRLAKHYADLMGVWLAIREWEGVAWIETRYEDIVSNVEQEGRRVTEFLGVPWHERQARFFESGRPAMVRSPTYHDVRQPIYSRSVFRWHNYEKYLAPTLTTLKPFCEIFGYD
jgi:hypothetical protein